MTNNILHDRKLVDLIDLLDENRTALDGFLRSIDRWLFKEVLPEIRRTGSYQGEAESVVNDADLYSLIEETANTLTVAENYLRDLREIATLKLPRDQEKELADQAQLTRAWKAWHREQFAETLAGPHGATIAELMTSARPARAELRRGALKILLRQFGLRCIEVRETTEAQSEAPFSGKTRRQSHDKPTRKTEITPAPRHQGQVR